VKSSLSCQGQLLLSGPCSEVHVSCALLLAPILQDSSAPCCKTFMLNISMVPGSVLSVSALTSAHHSQFVMMCQGRQARLLRQHQMQKQSVRNKQSGCSVSTSVVVIGNPVPTEAPQHLWISSALILAAKTQGACLKSRCPSKSKSAFKLNLV